MVCSRPTHLPYSVYLFVQGSVFFIQISHKRCLPIYQTVTAIQSPSFLSHSSYIRRAFVVSNSISRLCYHSHCCRSSHLFFTCHKMPQMKWILCGLISLGSLATISKAHPVLDVLNRRTQSPDNTCGNTGAGNQGFTCSSSNVGSCCSSKGWCGSGPMYCGVGCQEAFGTCQTTTPQTTASPEPTVPSVSTPSTAQGSPTSDPQIGPGCPWNIPNAGIFTHSLMVDFTKLSDFPSTGLKTSTVNIAAGSSPFSQQYVPANVAVADGSLQLKVPGGQTSSPIQGAQIVASDQDILYGSVRTTAQASSVAGTVHGFFYYGSDTNEADIEILTSNLGTGPHYTNQPHTPGSPSTTSSKPLAFDATSGFHEYRLDWLPGRTVFYVDGVQQSQLESNVPSTPGAWVWNNWSNGGAWGNGPPRADNVLKISKIEMYYNRTSSAGSC